MIPQRTSPFLTVTIAGAAVLGCWVDAATDGIAPEVGSASLRVMLGQREIDGVILSIDPIINPRQSVVIASTDGLYTWNGEVISVERMAAAGQGRWMIIKARGDGAAFERAYLSTFRAISYGTGPAPFITYRSRDLNENENADCSAATYPLSGMMVNVVDTYDNNRILWTQSAAIKACIAVAIADSGLPLTSFVDASGLMTKTNTYRNSGRSIMAIIGGIVGARSDACWRIDRDGAGNRVVTVLPARGGGKPVDLTSPFITNLSHLTDGQATLAAARYVASKQQFITTLQLFPGSTGGNLLADWTADDVIAWEGGDDNSPAYRRFRLDPSIPLPDGSSAGNARLMGGIPMQVESLSGRTVLGGPGYSSGGISMWQDGSTSLWTSLSGQVSITRRDDQNGVWIDGANWINIYLRAYRVAFTVAMESIQSAQVSNMGGAGAQVGLVSAHAGQVCILDAGTYIGVNDAGAVVTAGPVVFRNDIPKMQDMLNAFWEWYSQDIIEVSWTELGSVNNGFRPGDVISAATMFTGDGTVTETRPVNSVVSRRTIRWNEKGCSIAISTARLPPDLNGIAGEA